MSDDKNWLRQYAEQARNSGCWNNLSPERADAIADALARLEAIVADMEVDHDRLEWLLTRGIAWRDCYDRVWQEGEWLYRHQDARGEIDNAMVEARAAEAARTGDKR